MHRTNDTVTRSVIEGDQSVEIILNIERPLDKRTTESKSITIDNINEKLLNIINCYVEREAYLSFESYYQDTSLMNFSGCFPYIIHNDRYLWNVPYEEVTISDFIKTHNIDPNKGEITVYVNDFGGGDAILITSALEWLMLLGPGIIKTLIAFGGVAAGIDYICKLLKCITDRISKIPSVDNFAEALNKRKTWKAKKVGKMLGIEDERVTSNILRCLGFQERKGSFYRNKARFLDTKDSMAKFAQEWWGEEEHDDCEPVSEIKWLTRSVNIILADIQICSILLKSDCFDIAYERIHTLIEQFDYFETGTDLKYLMINESVKKADAFDLEDAESELRNCIAFLQELQGYLQTKDCFK